jgi:hypothetical protein
MVLFLFSHVLGRPDQTTLRFPPRKRARLRRPGRPRHPARLAGCFAASSSAVVCFRGNLRSALAFAAPGAAMCVCGSHVSATRSGRDIRVPGGAAGVVDAARVVDSGVPPGADGVVTWGTVEVVDVARE